MEYVKATEQRYVCMPQRGMITAVG